MWNKLILLLLSLVFLPACINFGGGLQFSYNLPSVGEGIAPSDSEYFYIDLDTDKYKSAGNLVPYYEISTTTEYGDSEKRDSLSNCEIFYDSDSEDEDGIKTASEESLICILDLLEYEFWAKDVHINYNVPEGMCDYVRVGLPWHYNHEILPGPIVYEKEEDKNPPEPSDCKTNSDVDCEKEQFFCDRNRVIDDGDGDASDGDGGSDVVEYYCISAEDNTEEDLCPEVVSYNEGEPVRCCWGGSKLDETIFNPDIRCFGGPAMIAEMEGYQRDNFNSRLVIPAPEGGLNGYIKLQAIDSIDANVDDHISAYISNYLTTLDQSPEKLRKVNRKKDLPDFLQYSEVYEETPRLFFELACLDSAGEVLHKILMMIREWNTYEEFRDFYDDGGNDSSNPDVIGIEGEDCDYEDFSTLEGEAEYCNDLADLDDIGSCYYTNFCYARFKIVSEDEDEDEEGEEEDDDDENDYIYYDIGNYPRAEYPEGGTVSKDE